MMINILAIIGGIVSIIFLGWLLIVITRTIVEWLQVYTKNRVLKQDLKDKQKVVDKLRDNLNSIENSGTTYQQLLVGLKQIEYVIQTPSTTDYSGVRWHEKEKMIENLLKDIKYNRLTYEQTKRIKRKFE